MHRFFAPIQSFAEGSVTLDEQESRHLQTVLRLRHGDEVFVFDGAGTEFLCRVDNSGNRRQALTVVSQAKARSPESPLKLTLACAMLKGDKFDLVVQKAVELGVSELVPLATERCDVKLVGSEKRAERWARIALEATKQCGRARLMAVSVPRGLDDFATDLPEGIAMLFAEKGGSRLDSISNSSAVTAVVGPEGGWSVEEIEKARQAGFSIITFGGRILRAETASIVVAALLQHRYGDLN